MKNSHASTDLPSDYAAMRREYTATFRLPARVAQTAIALHLTRRAIDLQQAIRERAIL